MGRKPLPLPHCFFSCEGIIELLQPLRVRVEDQRSWPGALTAEVTAHPALPDLLIYRLLVTSVFLHLLFVGYPLA